MKRIDTYIQEKLHINKNVKLVYNPDDLNNIEIVLYSDYSDEDNEQRDQDFIDMQDFIEETDNKYDGHFIILYDISKRTYHNVLNDIKNSTELDITHNDTLSNIYSNIVTGKDAGYEFKLWHGHVEIDCINSGSRNTYSIYAISDNMNKLIDNYLSGYNITIEDLYKALMTKGNILEIE